MAALGGRAQKHKKNIFSKGNVIFEPKFLNYSARKKKKSITLKFIISVTEHLCDHSTPKFLTTPAAAITAF